jgi:hypothetical protein
VYYCSYAEQNLHRIKPGIRIRIEWTGANAVVALLADHASANPNADNVRGARVNHRVAN